MVELEAESQPDMIGSLRGTVLERHGEGTTLIEVGGVGYLVTVTPRTLAELEPTSPAFLYIHHHIREDTQTLFGFLTRDEKNTFQILLATQGSKLEVWVGTVSVAVDLPWTIQWTEISATVANAKDAAGELLWPKHAILGNLAAYAISTMDVNNDGQVDIGITAGVIFDPSPIPPPAMDIYWFDGITHEPLETILLPDPIDFTIPTTEE